MMGFAALNPSYQLQPNTVPGIPGDAEGNLDQLKAEWAS
jgi:hypothetical protein